jgi:cobalt/nickel transport system permease protein
VSTAVSSRQTSYAPWLEHTIAGISGSIEHAVFSVEHARRQGWLQSLDPRVKILMFVALIVAASASGSLVLLAALYALLLCAARASQVPFDFFVKRTWLGIPFFAGIVIVPSILFGQPPHLFALTIGPTTVGLSIPALASAVVFVARVGVCVSLAVLLVTTTRWYDLLKSLQALHVPKIFVLILAMTYRYVFLFLHTLNSMLEARKSRLVARLDGNEERRWITRSMGSLLNRSFKMSNDVYAAMLARGFGGEIKAHITYRLRAADYIAASLALITVVAISVGGRWAP